MDRSEEEALPALLWDEVPNKAEQHPDYMAIQSLMYDESTPLEQAENFKEQGNQRLKVAVKSKNKVYLQEAIKYYTQGLDVELDGHSDLKSILYSNRAQAEIHLRNWRKALRDCEEALKWNPTNLKACYRGAKAAMQLDEVESALNLCMRGLKLDPMNSELSLLHTEAQERAAVLDRKKSAAQQKRAVLEKEAHDLMVHFSKRQIRLCQSNFKVGKLKPYVDEGDILHWPVLFVYPETMQQDIIQDVAETDLISELTDTMFAPDAEPLVWDTDLAYQRDTIDVYYLANAGEPFSEGETLRVLMGEHEGDPELHAPKLYGDKAAYFSRVALERSLQAVLAQPDCVVPGVPTFFIVARGSKFHERFLQSVSEKRDR